MDKDKFDKLREDIGPTEGHLVTMVLSYDFNNLDCNPSILAIMMDSFLHGTEQIHDTIDSVIDDEAAVLETTLSTSSDFKEGRLSENSILEQVNTSRDKLYDHLIDMVDREYHNLELAALPAMKYIADGYYVSEATPLGTDMIIILDSGE